MRGGVKPNVVLTSPPYNTSRNANGINRQDRIDKLESRYDIYLEERNVDEYCQWTCDVLNSLDKVLNKNGVVLYNMSYGGENPDQIWRTINDIIVKTNFTCADTIIWKKNSALPNNTSSNKLTRICEFVFVLCRKDEYKTFQSNKQITKIRDTGQKYYENVFNFIEAKNNDGTCKLNKATFSSDLVLKLLNMYAKQDDIVYDCFMGTGTTAVGCIKYGCKYIGSELSQAQCEFARDRIENL